MSLSSLIQKAEALSHASQFSEAISAWRQVIAYGRRAPDGAYSRLAQAHRKLGQFGECEAVLRSAQAAGNVSTTLMLETAQASLTESDMPVAIARSELALDIAANRAERETALLFLARVRAKNGNIDKARDLLRECADSTGGNPSGDLRHTAAFVDLQEQKSSAADGWAGYWQQRKDYVYLHVARQLIRLLARSASVVADIGSNKTPTLDFFEHADTKYSVDISAPYVADGVISVTEDFFTWQPIERIQFGTCMQVMEHHTYRYRIEYRYLYAGHGTSR